MNTTKITFKEIGEFQALWAAEDWCRVNGFSYGSLCRDEPVAIMRGDVLIAKWRNLTLEERKSIDGHMTSRDFRNGPVTIEILTEAPKP